MLTEGGQLVDRTFPPVLLAVLLVGGAWIFMKAWLGLVVALGWLRLPKRRSAFVKWLEAAMSLEEVGTGRRLDMAAVACLGLIIWNGVPLVFLFPFSASTWPNLVLDVVYYGVELCYLWWLAGYVRGHRVPE